MSSSIIQGVRQNERVAVAASTRRQLVQDTLAPGDEFVWPQWARTARIAGAYFYPGESEAAVDARLDALVAQNVSVVLADSPWGEQYAAWVDDIQFEAVRATIASMVEKAHDRGLKVVLYQVGLELLAPPERNPGLEYPQWAQIAIDGEPVLFNDISDEEQHWLDEGVWAYWLTPCGAAETGSGTFRELSLARVQAMVETGIDGLWVDQVYLQSSVGNHHELWPSHDPCSVAAFEAETGLVMPPAEDWDDPAFQRWVVWRHSQITDFLLAEKQAGRAINPQLVFLHENSSVDAGRSTYVAADPAALLPYDDISTGHEIETVGDRIDLGEKGMTQATLDDWLAFRTMVAFARGVDKTSPSWVLTYGYVPRDSAQLAGLVLAEGANFYETRGPQMADTVGESFRRQLFGWIAQHETLIYGDAPLAQVGLLYSPRNRDLIDTVSGEPYDVADSLHFATYRAVANLLYRAHIPFHVVIDTDVDAFSRYAVLIAPQLQIMSDATVSGLEAFDGSIVAVGPTGLYDEWLNLRANAGLSGTSAVYLTQPDAQLVALADTGFLSTDAPSAVQMGLRQHSWGYSLIVVNTGQAPTGEFTVELEIPEIPETLHARMVGLDGAESPLAVQILADPTEKLRLQFTVPAGLDAVALLVLEVDKPAAEPCRLWLPGVTG